MADRLHLSVRHRRVLEALLRTHLPDVEVWAYGSRVNGRSHDGSDLDLVLRGPGLREIPGSRLADFEEALRESTIPFLVEARDWARLPERFHREIEREYIELLAPPKLLISADSGSVREWVESTLGDVTDFLSGGTPAKSRAEYWGGSIPWVSAKDMKRFRLDDTEDYVTEVGVDNGTKLVPEGTVLLLARGMTLINDVPICVAQRPVTFNQDVKALRPKPLVNPECLPYLLLGNKQRLLSLVDLASHGTGRLNSDDLKALPILLPPYQEQNAIARILGTLDDKIELNRRTNETLEAMARAIFKDWFVDFGPTRAQAEGRAPYLSPELWNLFPDALDEEGKPVGWQWGTLADIAESPRRSISPADVSENTPYIGLEHMPRRSIALSEWEGAGNVKSNKTQFHRGEVLFGKLRPYFHKVGIAPLDGICSTDIVVATPLAQEWGAFALACLSSDEFVDYADRTSTGTKMPRTSWKTMARFKVCLPPERLVSAYQRVARPLLDRLGANVHETSTLAQTRDLLLPKLMSGEIRLREAEAAVQAAAP